MILVFLRSMLLATGAGLIGLAVTQITGSYEAGRYVFYGVVCLALGANAAGVK